MANQSHTSYVLKGYLFWGVNLHTHKPSGKEPSRWSRSRNQAPKPRGRAKACCSSIKEKYTTPQWAGISATIG